MIDTAPHGTFQRYSAKRNLHHARFFCHAPQARSVALVGDFNGWDPGATPMMRQPDGNWMTGLELSHGYHQYHFLVDGEPTLDPNAAGKTVNERNQPVCIVAVS